MMNWFKQVFLRRRLYRDLSAEIQEHIEERSQELMQDGLSQEAALAAARREFGNASLIEERGREVWTWSWLEAILRDVRFACRQLRRHPGFSLTVILTLALAIGANTAVFSMVSALLIRPLPYDEPERLASLTTHLSGVTPGGRVVDQIEDGQDGETWELVRDGVPSVFPAAYSFASNGVSLAANHQIRYVQNHRISASFFDVLGIKPMLGRNFTREEDLLNGPHVAILSFELWQSMFSADRDILGKKIQLKGDPYTIVGVMPPRVESGATADLWTPIQPRRGGEGGGDNYHVVMRLRNGATWARVNSQLQPLHPEMFDHFFKGSKSILMATPFQQALAEEKRRPTLILMSAVGMILLIAAVNLSGLILVRFSRRNVEIATRMALGATRAAIVRQVLIEPILLTLAGATCGLLLAILGLKSFAGLFPAGLLPLGGIAIDGRVLAFTALTTTLVSLFIATFPAVASRRVKVRPSLSGLMSDNGHKGRTRQILIASEVCLTLVLLAGAGLLIRTLIYLQKLPAGFDGSNVLAAQASLDDSRYHDPAAFQKLIRESLAAMKQIPGVESAAVGLSLPYERGLNDGFKVIDGPRADTQMASSSAYVSPEYFRALRIPVLAGRAFTDDDTSTSEPVVMVNSSFAKKHMGTLDVVGLHLALGRTKCAVIGIVGDVKKRPGIGMEAPLSTEPVYYIPFTQVDEGSLELIHVWFEPSWLVRTRGPISGLPAAMQSALAKADQELPFASFHQLSELQGAALALQRTEVMLLTVLAGLALLLSIVGIYGLVSHVVVQRRREIGIRMAMGCSIPRAMAAVARSGFVAAFFGLAGGLTLSTFVLRVLKSELYGVRSFDATTLAVASVLLLSVALLASVVPALRIVSVSPASTLRSE